MGAVAFKDLITFTRASGGGRFNAAGQYEWLAADQPRIDYDPVTGECLGLLIEEQRTNLLPYSSDFANAAWSKTRATVSPAELSRGFILHTITASETNSNGFQVSQGGVSVSSASSLTASFVAKKGTSDWLMILLADSAPANGFRQWFNLATGQVGGVSPFGTGWSKTAATIQPLGDGLFRVSVTAAGTGTSARATVYPSVSGDLLYGCNVGDVGRIAAAQLEAGSSPSSYIPTTDAQVTRASDIPSVNVLSPWYRADEGTLFVEASTFVPPTPGVVPTYYATLQGGSSEIMVIYRSSISGRGGLYLAKSGATIHDTAFGPVIPANTVAKAAVTYDATAVRAAFNGEIGASPSVDGPPIPVQLVIGNRIGVSRAINGHIRSIRYFPRRLSDAELQALTA